MCSCSLIRKSTRFELYALTTILIINVSTSYGTPTVHSGYEYSNKDQGAPDGSERHLSVPQFDNVVARFFLICNA